MGPSSYACSWSARHVRPGDNCASEGREGWDNSCLRSSKEKKSTVPSRSADRARTGVSRTVKASAARREFLTLLCSAGTGHRVRSHLVYIFRMRILLANGGFLYGERRLNDGRRHGSRQTRRRSLSPRQFHIILHTTEGVTNDYTMVCSPVSQRAAVSINRTRWHTGGFFGVAAGGDRGSTSSLGAVPRESFPSQRPAPMLYGSVCRVKLAVREAR